MSAPDFLDTNVLVYAYDPTDRAKQSAARDLLRHAQAESAVVSAQVMAEFAATMFHKLSPAARPEQVQTALDALAFLAVVDSDAALVRRAVEVRAKYGLHFYDCLIVAAAERGGCDRIWSEDLNAGQTYFGITVENPFR
jgi:predicted nucleic acid-binding protein